MARDGAAILPQGPAVLCPPQFEHAWLRPEAFHAEARVELARLQALAEQGDGTLAAVRGSAARTPP